MLALPGVGDAADVATRCHVRRAARSLAIVRNWSGEAAKRNSSWRAAASTSSPLAGERPQVVHAERQGERQLVDLTATRLVHSRRIDGDGDDVGVSIAAAPCPAHCVLRQRAEVEPSATRRPLTDGVGAEHSRRCIGSEAAADHTPRQRVGSRRPSRSGVEHERQQLEVHAVERSRSIKGFVRDVEDDGGGPALQLVADLHRRRRCIVTGHDALADVPAAARWPSGVAPLVYGASPGRPESGGGAGIVAV